MVTVFFAEGFEEIEALMPLDILRRAGLDVKSVSIGERTVTGSHGIPVVCDCLYSEIDLDNIELLILPGGMPGSLNLDKSDFVDKAIAKVSQNGGRIAAICAAPLILGRRGLLKGKKATCYPGFEDELIGAHTVSDSFVTDGNITTARGMGVALNFAKELVRLMLGDSAKEKISKSIEENNVSKN